TAWPAATAARSCVTSSRAGSSRSSPSCGAPGASAPARSTATCAARSIDGQAPTWAPGPERKWPAGGRRAIRSPGAGSTSDRAGGRRRRDRTQDGRPDLLVELAVQRVVHVAVEVHLAGGDLAEGEDRGLVLARIEERTGA